MATERKFKNKLMAWFLAVAVAITMIPGSFMLDAPKAEAASKISLKTGVISGGGDYCASFSGDGYYGLCARARTTQTKKGASRTYTLNNPNSYCSNQIMQKLAYYYGYQKGWTKGENGVKLARAFNYVNQQSGPYTGKAYHFKKSTLQKMVDTVKNVKVPEGFICYLAKPDGTKHRWQSAVIWKMIPAGSVKLVKSSAVSGYSASFAGIVYTVYKSDKKTVAGKLTCTASGATNTLALQPGTYYVKETKTNANYNINSTWYTAKVTSNKLTTLTVKDSAAGSFALQKKFTPDSDEDSTLAGFTFTLTNTATGKKYSGTTDASGKLNISGIVPGTYKVSETIPKALQIDHYRNETGVKTISIANGKTASIEWTNSHTTEEQLRIIKETGDGGELSGFHFDIKGEIPGQALTAAKLTSNAQVKTVTKKDGFTLGSFSVDEAELKAMNDDAEAKKTGEYTIHLTATATKAAAEAEGKDLSEFKNAENEYVFAKDDIVIRDNIKYTAVKDGTYTQEQIEAEEDNPFDDEECFVEYEAEGETETISIPVKVTLKSIFEKKEDNSISHESKTLSEPEGWQFTYNDFEWPGSADTYHKNDEQTTTGENGTVTIKDIPKGVYTVTEEMTDAQKLRYRQPEAITINYSDDNQSEAVFSFENAPKWTPVQLKKTNAKEGGKVEGFEFTLTGKRAFDGEDIEPIKATTDEEGMIDFGNLYAGDYVIEETGFDKDNYVFRDEYRLEGHENPAVKLHVSGEEEDTITVDFVNDPLTLLYLTKVDKASQDFLTGATFDLYEKGNKAVTFRIVRDKEGRAVADIKWKSEETSIFADPAEIEEDVDQETPVVIDGSDEDTQTPSSGEEAEAGDQNVESGNSDEPGETGEEGGGKEGEDVEADAAYNYAVLKGCQRDAEYRIVETVPPKGYSATIDYTFTFTDEMKPIVLENTEPEIGTIARDSETGMNMSNAGQGKVTIIDAVYYNDLEPGKEYQVHGTLMYKPEEDVSEDGDVGTNADADPVLIDGKKVENTIKFTPKEAKGEVEIPFTLDASEIAGKKTVVFEDLIDPELSEGNQVICSHADPNNEKQSIYFTDLKTTAVADDTQEHVTNADSNVVITDKVEYSNVVAGKVYTVVGTLMNKKTGKPITVNGEKVTASQSFIATENGAELVEEGTQPEETAGDTVKLVSGTVEIQFVFDGSGLAGTKTVAFEELITDEKTVGSHTDINDEDQSVNIPDIGTKASLAGRSTVKDLVAYKNLVPGKEYVMKGSLVEKSSGKVISTAEQKFTPKEENGSITIKFKIDRKKVAGKSLVAFEECYLGKHLVGKHKDLNDKDQTVRIPSSPQTGDNSNALFAGLIALIALAGAGTGIAVRRKMTK